MKRWFALFAVLATASFAQQRVEKKQPAPKPPPVQMVDFSDDEITGDIASSHLEQVMVPKRPIWKSRIPIRENFNDKLLESVHEL